MRIIGCGNCERSDDGAGALAIERLRALGVESLNVIAKTCSGEATELIDAWGSNDDVIIVDALMEGVSAGTVHRWDDGVRTANRMPSSSTHGFGVNEAIRLAEALGRSPKSVQVYGIEGKSFDCGSQVSPEVQQGVEQAVQLINAEIRAMRGR
jgi:hydrogenase maturation protease